MVFGQKNSNFGNVSRNEKRRESAAAKEMKGFGYEFVSEFPVGQDPGTGAVHSFVVGRSVSTPSQAAFWHAVDWSQVPRNKARGLTLNAGQYNLTIRDAEAGAKEAAEEYLARWSWVRPGTRTSVVGSADTKTKYMTQSCSGHKILAIYVDEHWLYDRPKYYAVATREGLGPGLIWGRDYDMTTGLWQGGDYHLTRKQIEQKCEGMRVIYIDQEALDKAFAKDGRA